MKKYGSAIVLLVILLLQATLAIVPTISVASATGNVTINDFTINATKGQFPLQTRLTSNVTGNATNWLWEFYNPNFNISSYSTANITTFHEFGAAGVAYGFFNVTLDVWGPEGSDHLKKIDYVVTNKNTTGLPNASFVSSTISGNAPLNVTFTDNSTNETSREWYFGLQGTSTEQNPTFTFNYPGTYRVVLAVSNERGFDATDQEIIVQGQPQENVLPVADFDSETSNGLNVQFVDTSQNANTTNWDFGDGTNSTDFSPAHTYSTAGTYTVNLTVSNENGTASKTATINVSEIPVSILPVANFSSNVTSGNMPLSVQFNDSSENATQWLWDFGDGTNSSELNPMHIYSTAGNYTVNLTVSNEVGSDTKTGFISVLTTSKNETCSTNNTTTPINETNLTNNVTACIKNTTSPANTEANFTKCSTPVKKQLNTKKEIVYTKNECKSSKKNVASPKKNAIITKRMQIHHKKKRGMKESWKIFKK